MAKFFLKRPQTNAHGFSLVELSIVLVILGLLTGGILGGQSLMRAAELRSVTTEFKQYQSAVNVFKDKYFALPGDMPNAIAFWGDEGNCPAVLASTHTTALSGGTCNGSGDGKLAPLWATAGRYESFLFWQQLQLAGLISGNYTGVRGPTDNRQHVIGVNAPKAKLGTAGWSVVNDAPSGNVFTLDYGNTFLFGTNAAPNLTYDPVITPEEAWNIDTKIDDGKPAQGKLIAWHYSTCADGASVTDYDADYQLSANDLRCALIFRHGM